MDKIFQALYYEIAHGDQEHRDWLYQKMQEFFEREVGKQLKSNMAELMAELETLQAQGHPLTQGQ